ncbi:hypothetical protein CNECB9_4370009 [Cupriavidus necator]|uniref:Uncharacterized protein n=1 Tax=Cupriavidus necator TaxID=106590 RepID=A0A1K0ILE1_CUPNE|nr:hypothetical protein CNECB9_4370009 [Cupriavidus necator]
MVIQLSQPEVPQRLHGVTLVDRHGLPRFWANVWALMALADHAELTRLRKLHHVERLYAYADAAAPALPLSAVWLVAPVPRVPRRGSTPPCTGQIRWRTHRGRLPVDRGGSGDRALSG